MLESHSTSWKLSFFERYSSVNVGLICFGITDVSNTIILEVEGSGGLEDKALSAVALLCSDLVARPDIFVDCARYNRRNKSGKRSNGRTNNRWIFAGISNYSVDSSNDGCPVP